MSFMKAKTRLALIICSALAAIAVSCSLLFLSLREASSGQEIVGLSLAKTRSPLVSTTWKMGCNVVEIGYKISRRRILELDDILARDRLRWPHTKSSSMAPVWPSPPHASHSQNVDPIACLETE